MILNLIVGDVLQVEEFNFSFAVPPDFDALKSINLPSSVLGGFNLISPEMPTIVIKVHKNETGLSVSDWYYENMSDNEFWVHGFKVQDSDTRIEREIIVSGRTALHIESEMMGVRQIRTWVPNDTTILEVSTSLSDVADVSGAYWQVLDSLDLL